ncbi:Metallo-dependent phosphatase-like protein [Lophiotrema nucula]|uniref:Metallo-dependent phosphatase-like protein n=1 Tax=Lophiotrema nucula TaxID=690887 RepID=A0A6A5Z863_9PLEO|nr:Metallo-dependent phosphatase-like protein [Lophiotrema nucula]
MSTSPKIKTRFLILSDTHTATPSSAANNNVTAFRSPLPRADVLLHCGDLTMIGHLEEYEKTLSFIAEVDAPLKLVIAGNHDISLDEEYYARRGQSMQRLKTPDADLPRRARELWTGERARAAGVRYLEEGTHEFTLMNGGKLRVYASPYQPEFCDYRLPSSVSRWLFSTALGMLLKPSQAFPYFRNQDRFNPPHAATPGAVPIATNPVPDFPAIDVMMTHGPPMNIRDEVRFSGGHVGCEHLLRAARRCKPRLHCFGHIHEGWGAELVTWKEGEEVDDKWEEHVTTTKVAEVDEEKAREDGGVYVDASESEGGGKGVDFGRETLMVNASIMTVRYKPCNAPWVVDLDLEKAV